MSEQWNVVVQIAELDRGQASIKNRWNQGEKITVQIEPHATVGMLKQRIALIVAAHEKWQTLKVNDVILDPIAKLDSIEGFGNNTVVQLFAKCPQEAVEDLGELSDDPEAMGDEDAALPSLPEGAAMDTELAEADEDKQNALKQEAAEALEDGDKDKALSKMSDAIMVGNPNAMLLSKRAELLLKMKRPRAAIQDASAALAKNPDSAKAFRARGRAHRLLSMWDQAVDDFAQCQNIDYDDSIADVHKFCTRRKVWHSKTAMRAKKAEEKEKADAAAEAKAAAAEAKAEAKAKA